LSKPRDPCCRLVFVEDTYGVGFHRLLLEYIGGKGGLRGMPRVRRFPAKKCNPKIFNSIIGATIGCRKWKVLVVIDQETHKTSEEAAEKDFLSHVKRHRNRFRVAVVQPRHEAWLCIGLGLGREKCREDPESAIERLIDKPYEKRFLSKAGSLAGSRFDPARLEKEKDFIRYVKALEWLAEC